MLLTDASQVADRRLSRGCVCVYPREAAFYLFHFLQVEEGRRGGPGTPGAGWVPALNLLAQCLLRPYPGPKGLIFDYVLTQPH